MTYGNGPVTASATLAVYEEVIRLRTGWRRNFYRAFGSTAFWADLREENDRALRQLFAIRRAVKRADAAPDPIDAWKRERERRASLASWSPGEREEARA
jgi:hypothetical protein